MHLVHALEIQQISSVQDTSESDVATPEDVARWSGIHGQGAKELNLELLRR